MKNRIMVINLKRIILSAITMILLILLCASGNFIVENVLETANSKRRLPIYSVERTDKMVALTFDCAWSRSQ